MVIKCPLCGGVAKIMHCSSPYCVWYACFKKHVAPVKFVYFKDTRYFVVTEDPDVPLEV